MSACFNTFMTPPFPTKYLQCLHMNRIYGHPCHSPPCPRFNGNTFEPNMKFELIGVLMGIAIFNRVILDLHFPMIAYGKILGRKPTIESLEEYMPVGCVVVWLCGCLVAWLFG